MKGEYPASIESALSNLTEGQMKLNLSDPNADSILLSNHFDCRIQGKGEMQILSLFPGVELCFNRFIGSSVQFRHDPRENVLKINHCHLGRAGWEMQEGLTVYLGPGDLSLHPMYCCAHSLMRLPLGYYEGLSLSIDLSVFCSTQDHYPAILKDANVDILQLYQRFCPEQKPGCIAACEGLDRLFSPLYEVPSHLLIPYCKLKAMELLLYLSSAQPCAANGGECSRAYSTQQTATIRQIHDLLVNNLQQRFTIDELSRRYLVNTSFLKAAFKTVYGQPIASYMKEYRIKKAMELLRTTDDSIASIATCVGYETQGKFTKAFKDVALQLPTEYRKIHRHDR